MNEQPKSAVSISRRITFCAGHRLLHHGGKCENLHGHNYVIEVSVSGERTDAIGRLVDFSLLNRLFKDWIDENWDHAMVLSIDDREGIEAIRSVNPHRIYLLPWNPTAENMARYLLERVGPLLMSKVEGYDLRVTRVVLWENESSCAEVTLVGEPKSDGTDWSQAPAWQQAFSG
jgi:6-pyruvoyltetrahydropterin/6-carboxytetrahydropterin synthase